LQYSSFVVTNSDSINTFIFFLLTMIKFSNYNTWLRLKGRTL